MTIDQDIALNVELLRERSGGLKPRVGIVLGSGLGPLADDVMDATVVHYGDLSGFPAPGVAGAGEWVEELLAPGAFSHGLRLVDPPTA